jgi:hypothetical protein
MFLKAKAPHESRKSKSFAKFDKSLRYNGKQFPEVVAYRGIRMAP